MRQVSWLVMDSWSRLIRTVLAAAALGGLAACGGPMASRRVLRVAAWGGADDGSRMSQIERSVYRDFERLHPGVEIQLENTPDTQDYVKKMLLSFIARSEPDVMRLDASSAAVFMDNGVLMDLTPRVNGPRGVRLDDWFPNIVNIARRGKALYAVPVDFTPLVVYYNRRLFDQAGVSYPKPGWTWDDFLAKAKALTRDGRHGYVLPNWLPGWLPWVWNNGGDVLGPDGRASGTADSDPSVEGVAWLRDLVNLHKAAPSLSQVAAQGVEPFHNGQAAMETSGHWNLMGLAEAPGVKLSEVGVAPLPVARKGRKPVTVVYESGWAIGRNCRQADLAWEFIRYFTSRDIQRRVQATGIGVCARKDVARERAVNDVEREFLRIVPSGRPPWGATVEGWDYVESEGQRAMDGILKSGKDPRRAMKEFAVSVDRQLAKS